MTIETVTSETLADFNAARTRTMEPEPAKPKVEAKEPGETPVAELAEEDKPDEAEEGEAPPKKSNKLELRFSELTTKARAAEERAAAAEARAAAAEAKLTPKPAAEPDTDGIGPKPKSSDYTDAFEYAEHLAEWSANKALSDDRTKRQQDAENERRGKVIDGWKTRVEAAKTKYPDFDVIMASGKGVVSDPARDALIESEFGADITYTLQSDDDLAAKVNAMKPADQVKWIGRMEATFDKAAEAAKKEEEEPAVKERVRAPAPIVPVRGSRKADSLDDTGEFKGTYAQYKAARLAQMR